MSLLVPRWVELLANERDSAASDSLEQKHLADFATEHAWVLLGEPGSGKSTALKEEAERVGGAYISVAELMATEPLPDEWRDTTLFLDGLDEAAEGNNAPNLYRLANKLRQLGQPNFRLACRAADWQSQVYAESLQRVSPSTIKELRLLPLTEQDILDVLEANFSISDGEAFLTKAKQSGIDSLLTNPQMLKLMVFATQKGLAWPETRTALFEHACSALVQEKNLHHQILQKAQPVRSEAMLAAAGECFALMLLAGKSGVATDEAVVSDLFPYYETLYSADAALALVKAMNTPLFVPSMTASRLVPCHRLVAEYLAARWLGGRLGKHKIIPRRLFRLLFSSEGRVFGSLRGLAGWLASLNVEFRQKLIQQDVMAVVNYADMTVFSTAHRHAVLEALKAEAQKSSAFMRQSKIAEERLADLASVDMLDDLLRHLGTTEHSSENETHVFTVLNVVAGLAGLSALRDDLYAVVSERKHWRVNRALALSLWLKQAMPADIESVLNDLQTGQLEDNDDELLGTLLNDAYPSKISTDVCLQHLRQNRDDNLIGTFYMFWEHQFLLKVPDNDLPAVLDHLAQRTDLFGNFDLAHKFRRLADVVLVRALHIYGDEIANDQLFHWLGVGADKLGGLRRGPEARRAVTAWLENRPDRCWAVLKHELEEEFEYDLGRNSSVLQGVSWSMELTEQCLQWIAQTDEALARNAMNRLKVWNNSDSGPIVALQQILDWQERYPEHADWVVGLLHCDLKERYWNYNICEVMVRQISNDQRRGRYDQFAPHLHSIAHGVAYPKQYRELADVWVGHFYGSLGDSVEDRFHAYCTNADKVQAAAREGFINCLSRKDVPKVKDILQLNTEGQHFYLALPCFIGADLLWHQDSRALKGLPDEVLQSLIAFYFTVQKNGTVEWFEWLAHERGEWVARIWVDFTISQWRAKKIANSELYALEQESLEYEALEKKVAYRSMALRVLPEMLQKFPLRATVEQYADLSLLLNLALKLMPEQLMDCVRQKLTKGSMVHSQRAHWLAVGLMLEPVTYIPAVVDYLEQSTKRATEQLLALHYFHQNCMDSTLPAPVISTFLEYALPLADLSVRKMGWGPKETPMNRLGEFIRTMMRLLEQDFSAAATVELARLKGLCHSEDFQKLLQDTSYQRGLIMQERQNQQHALDAVRSALLNQQPSSMADLQDILLDTLEYINASLRNSNDDAFRFFWNMEPKKLPVAREENHCRDVLLWLLRERLRGMGISFEPEGDQNADKRVDIRADFHNRWSLPIEIKKDSNPDLWTAIHAQLIPQYVSQERTEGYGIYLVLWFGAGKIKKKEPVTGTIPNSPDQLRSLLEAQLDEHERRRIKVVVLDVSLPKSP